MWKSLLLCHDRKDGSPSTKIPTKTKQILHTPLYPIFWTHEIKIYEKNCPFKNTNPLIIELTRKYPLRGYFLGVLTHTTALDRLWGGDETLTMWF